MSVKQTALHLLRHTRLLSAAEAARFRWQVLRGRGAREAFSTGHPDVSLPPDDIAYDAYGLLNWEYYWGFGQLAAQFLAPRILARGNTGRVLEWGCGPARIIRHLPPLLGAGWEVHATDANSRTITWCRAAIEGVRFDMNGEAPPLPFPSAHFDAVYAVSVFTHLSARLHDAWKAELRRIVRPGGLLILTLHGDASRALLLPFERRRYDRGELVVRGGVEGGTRCFLAYHPPPFVTRTLLAGFEVQEHVAAPNILGERQDVWSAVRSSEG